MISSRRGYCGIRSSVGMGLRESFSRFPSPPLILPSLPFPFQTRPATTADPNSIRSGRHRIFELQSRTLHSLLTVFLFGPLIAVLSPAFFWREPLQLFFTYLVPLIPFCLVYDGYISSLRTRTPAEVERLMVRANGGKRLEGWRLESGAECHTWPMGWMGWVVCVPE